MRRKPRARRPRASGEIQTTAEPASLVLVSPGCLRGGGWAGAHLFGARIVAEDTPGTASGLLRRVHRPVGVDEEGRQVVVGRAFGDADAGLVRERLPVAAMEIGDPVGQ